MRKSIILSLSVILLIASCAPVYIPSSPVIFHSEEQGDFSATVRQGFYSTNVQAGIAVTDHINIGVQGSKLYSGESSVGQTTYPGTDALQGSVIVGYYNRFTAKHTFELNGGVGALQFKYQENINGYIKTFIQPSITFNGNGDHNIDFTILTRGVGASFIANENGRDTAVFQGMLEPVLNLSVGKNVKFQTQAGLSLPLTKTYDNESSPFIFNIGLSIALPYKKKPTLP